MRLKKYIVAYENIDKLTFTPNGYSHQCDSCGFSWFKILRKKNIADLPYAEGLKEYWYAMGRCGGREYGGFSDADSRAGAIKECQVELERCQADTDEIEFIKSHYKKGT